MFSEISCQPTCFSLLQAKSILAKPALVVKRLSDSKLSLKPTSQGTFIIGLKESNMSAVLSMHSKVTS